jgi:hypothetical protein
MAYDVYYGKLTDEVKNAIQLNEEERTGVYNTSQEVISQLRQKWLEQSKYTSAIEETEASIKSLEASLSPLQKEYDSLTESIKALTKANNDLYESMLKVLSAGVNQTTGSNSGWTLGGGTTTTTSTSPWNAWTTPSGAPYDPYNRSWFNDFLWRPGQEPIRFSPQDTIVGFKGNSPLGGVTIQNINVSGVSGNPSEIAYELAREIKRELNALG